jgi:hypothetical protein
MENVISAAAAVAVNTTAERVGVVLLGAGVLVVTLVLVRRFYSPSVFHGFLAAVGVFFSFDLIVFHWVFGLHRITEGSEADVIEPVLVALGVGFVAYALMRERRPAPRT